MAKRQVIETPWKPSKQELQDARGKSVPDVIGQGLEVLFCGINPGLYSGATGHHFARPGNRFWPALHDGGFTERILSPFEELRLLEDRWGITNLVERATATADELSRDELREGARTLERKVKRFRPRWVAVLGLVAYRTAFEDPKAQIGLSDRVIAGASVWVLPNPSGLNAHFQRPDLAIVFKAFRQAVAAGERVV